MHVKLVSTDFNDKAYYTNIRKAITAGYFMQVRALPRFGAACGWCIATQQGEVGGAMGGATASQRMCPRQAGWEHCLGESVRAFVLPSAFCLTVAPP